MLQLRLSAQAALISVTDVGSLSELSPAISSTDLLETALASSTIQGFDPVGAYAPAAANGGGLFDGSSNVADGGYGFGEAYIDSSTGSEWSVTFTLDTSVNFLGYNISQINSFSGWNSGLASQDFTISYSLVGQEDFIELGRFIHAASDTGLVVSISDDQEDYLISGVEQIRFLHHTAAGDARGAYRELDVIGSAVAVPEPGAVALFAGLAGLAVVTLRRRKR